VVKSLDTFDFLAIPSLNKALVLNLARCEFIERKENILALGNSGAGKTHIALALGLDLLPFLTQAVSRNSTRNFGHGNKLQIQ
jgi:DNA replication protein DnaC